VVDHEVGRIQGEIRTAATLQNPQQQPAPMKTSLDNRESALRRCCASRRDRHAVPESLSEKQDCS